MTQMHEMIDRYASRVKELAEHVQGNEQATRRSLIGPFFAMLGHDPRELDFVVEARAVGRKLGGLEAELAERFAAAPGTRLGVLTNGAEWRFFSDVHTPDVMDREPFATWNILADEPPPYDILSLLEKATYDAETIRAYARNRGKREVVLAALARILDTRALTRRALAGVEADVTDALVAHWTPVIASAVREWARREAAAREDVNPVETIQRLLGPERPAELEGSSSDLDLHVSGARACVFARIRYDGRRTSVMVPMVPEDVTPLVESGTARACGGWTVVVLESPAQLGELGALLRAAYASARAPAVEAGATRA